MLYVMMSLYFFFKGLLFRIIQKKAQVLDNVILFCNIFFNRRKNLKLHW